MGTHRNQKIDERRFRRASVLSMDRIQVTAIMAAIIHASKSGTHASGDTIGSAAAALALFDLVLDGEEHK